VTYIVDELRQQLADARRGTAALADVLAMRDRELEESKAGHQLSIRMRQAWEARCTALQARLTEAERLLTMLRDVCEAEGFRRDADAINKWLTP